MKVRQHRDMLLFSIVLAALWASILIPAPAYTAESGGELIRVHMGQSKRISGPWPVKRVSVSDPKIADVQVLGPQEVLVQGKSVGTTDLFLWSTDEQVVERRVEVHLDLERLRQELKDLFPTSDLSVVQAGDVVAVRGDMARAESADEMQRFFEARDIKHVDMTSVAGVQQVLLKVRVAEVSRTALQAMTLNAFHTSEDFFGGSVIGSSGGAFNPISIGPEAGTIAGERVPFTFTEDVSVSPAATLFTGFPKAELEFFIQALAENQYLRTLAEPNLVTLSGEQASFLAGGQFPIPVVQGGSTDGTAVTIEYKEFGVRLNFLPQVLGEGTIRLQVTPEVSELTETGAVTIEGFTVPALVTRRAEATLQMKDGETFAMAGLISQSTQARNSRVPGLGNIPMLGALFRSVRYQTNETELVVLVTVNLVEPLKTQGPHEVPGAMHEAPDDWRIYVEGRIEKKEPPKISTAHADYLEKLGFSRLRGPGAWESYDQGAARSQAPLRADRKSFRSSGAAPHAASYSAGSTPQKE